MLLPLNLAFVQSFEFVSRYLWRFPWHRLIVDRIQYINQQSGQPKHPHKLRVTLFCLNPDLQNLMESSQKFLFINIYLIV